ncbi:MAG: glycosyltransferase family 39 protein [Anaerolineae bacterium]|nr:glycosyltransferase family 39 protein [Anaerolineae bacterium]MDW8102597.1 glycosyltransferase family 39 protein [Anaerolineae bacterium]
MNHRRLFFLILACYFALASIYSALTPLGEAPDEAPHFSVMVYIVRHANLPVGPEEHEGFQPPLYYILGATLASLFDLSRFAIIANSDYNLSDPLAPKNLLLHTSDEIFPFAGWAMAWRLVRILSMICGAITLWAIYRLGLLLYPDDPEVALGAVALTAFTPYFLFISGVANNDNLATAFGALTIFVVSFGLTRKIKRPELFAFYSGLLWGLGTISKVSLMVLGVPIVFLVLKLARDSQENRVWKFLSLSLLSAVGMLLPTSWWFIRNHLLYGDPLGWQLILQANALRAAPLSWGDLVWLARGLYRSWWLAWIGISLPSWLYWLLGLIPLAALLGWFRGKPAGSYPLFWGIMALYVLGVMVALLKWTATVLGTDQARLLYPALPVFSLFTAAGLRIWGKGLLKGVILGLLILAVSSPWLFIYPVHSPPPYIPAGEMPSPLAKFGDVIALQAFEMEPDPWVPGGVEEIKLTWRTFAPPKEHYWLYMRLVNEKGETVWFKDGSPTAGRDTTDRWPGGVLIPSRHRIYLPEGLAPGRYKLLIGFHRFGKWEWLPAFRGDRFEGDLLELTEISLSR